MNASNRILFALALSLAASTPAIAAADGALTLRCDAPAPSIHDVAQAFGIDNYDKAYDVRIRAQLIARRLCARGAEGILLVMEPADRDAAVLRGEALAQLGPR
ncbi:MAG: hypothetical protein KAX84_07975 [Burkholderiales bacterium]|nr:hypothetical protein [Burkholderiales bacterium]HQX25808.1 hypothetical protein [Pseudomonadota bacterium]